MVTKNTVQIGKDCGSSLFEVRVPKIILFGFCFWWNIRFVGTREECVEYCQSIYDIPWWKWPWNQDKILYGHS